MKRKEFLNQFTEQPVYLKNDAEGAVIRTEPANSDLKIWVKIKGKEEFEAKPGSSLVADSFSIQNRITKEEYYNF